MIDRDIENCTSAALANAGVGPKYFGRFANGRVEGWVPNSRPMKRKEMTESRFIVKNAAALSELHSFPVTEELQTFHSNPGMWDQLWLWFNQAKRDALTEGKLGADDAIRFQTIMEELVGLNFEKAQKELEMLQTLTEAAKSPVVFCHNDALADNILVVEETDVLLIDFEYGGCNYRDY